MQLKFTNAFGNKNNISSTNIDVDACTITNYEDGHSPSGAGDLTIDITGNSATVTKGRNNVNPDGNNTVNFNDTKYSIFNRLAMQDGNANNLTEQDLEKAKNLFKEGCTLWKLGVIGIEYNKTTHIAVVKIKDNQLLRFDFSKSANVNAQEPSQTKTSNTKMTIPPKMKEVSKTEKKKLAKELAECISKFKGGNIDISEVHDLDTVAKYTGISKEYIKSVLVDIEAHQGWPNTEAYDDLVPGKKTEFDKYLEQTLGKKYKEKNEQINAERAKKNKPPEPLYVTIRREEGYVIGTLTIGFGHTNLAGEPNIDVGLEITKEQAYQILANDIMNSVKLCKNKLGSLYTNAPKSIQNAIVDLAYNKGPGEINKSLIANLEAEYYHSAARRTWYETNNVGLQKRNMYRFIAAISDLKENEKVNAVKNFKSEHSKQLSNVFRRDIDAKKAWNAMCDKSNKLKEYKF